VRERRGAGRVFVEKPEGKRPLGRSGVPRNFVLGGGFNKFS
jgi:hypothetical protein